MPLRDETEKYMTKILKKALCAVLCLSFLLSWTVYLPTGIQALVPNEATIADFLKKQLGLNTAAISGVLANIEWESGFNPNVEGDFIDGKATSYGICQWHNSRWDRMKKFCTDNGYDWTTLTGQLWYLKYELENYYPSILTYLKSVPKNGDGAYDAGYYWCKYFERPADTENMSVKRGNLAKNKYWPPHSGNFCVVSQGIYRFVNKGEKAYLGVDGSGDANGQALNITADRGSESVFKLEKVYGTVYRIRSESSKSGKVVNIYASTVASGKKVTLYEQTDDYSQQWLFDQTTEGYIIRSAANTSCVLDCVDGKICVSTYTGAATQIWTLSNISNYTVSYDANGGYGAPAQQTKKHGQSLTLAKTAPKMDGYIFMGWATKSDSSEVAYAPGATLVYNGDLTLYAVWKIEPCEGSDGTGHKWTFTETTAPPTCEEKGKGLYLCSKCNKTEEMHLFDKDTVTDWLEEPLPDAFSDLCETKEQYRTTPETVSEGTVEYAVLPAGFDKDSDLYKTYGTVPENGETESTYRVYSEEKKTVGYIYWHWCSSAYTNTTPQSKYIDTVRSDKYDVFHAFFSTEYMEYNAAADATKFVKADECGKTWWWQIAVPVYSVSYTDYSKDGYGEWQDTKDPAYTGTYETRNVYRYDLSPLGHDNEKEVIAPTCTSDGFTLCTCRRCGKITKESTVTAPGHKFAETVVPPTCTLDGYTVFKCKSCDYTYSGNTVTTKGHSYAAVTVPSTCTAEGYTIHTCSVCSDSYTDSKTAMLPHDYKDGACTVCGSPDPDSMMIGDLNNDKKINSTDLSLLTNAVISGTDDGNIFKVGDLNSDSKLNAVDVNLLTVLILG